jgi:hypothetical protein
MVAPDPILRHSRFCKVEPEKASILPMQLRLVKFPVEDGQLLTQGEILFYSA